MIEDKELQKIQSWDSFKYALREENGDEGEGVQFANAVNLKGELFSACACL